MQQRFYSNSHGKIPAKTRPHVSISKYLLFHTLRPISSNHIHNHHQLRSLSLSFFHFISLSTFNHFLSHTLHVTSSQHVIF
ncbi:hypothetical protein QVD17_21391 [Tagetes erecta]|uniref:Uncharacterized protein n=1 Tax=Tagetes erecta TaxID=13708 RepID=A0AAD8NL68_TARER|nr:hypothetical protein QVD17_21391 [Tagetes erecta]